MKRNASETAAVVPAVAATVVLMRDGARGVEVLLLERPRDRGSFAGAWVFPGGGVDAEDLSAHGSPDEDEESIARRAAVREVREETGLDLQPDALVPTARWIPPAAAPKRLHTWFYYAPAPPGEITLPATEAVACAWFRPADALTAHGSGVLSLVPPTWVTLHGLTSLSSVEEALGSARHNQPLHYSGRLGTDARGPVVFWSEDVAFGDDALAEESGDRHRLEMADLPWVYSRSFAP